MDKDLGIVSAYGYAKSKGYTGTEQEFAQLMANYATVGQTCTTAAETATTKAGEASASANAAANSAEYCSGNAGFMYMYINENGDLIYEYNDKTLVTFNIDENGDLIMEGVDSDA